jgi:hypothetical protein
MLAARLFVTEAGKLQTEEGKTGPYIKSPRVAGNRCVGKKKQVVETTCEVT